MIRLLPSTLFGRLVIILLGGLLVAQGVGAWILLRDRATALYETGGRFAIQRIASIVHVLDTLSAEQRRTILPAVNSTGLRVGFTTAPEHEPLSSTNNPAVTRLRAALRRALGNDRNFRIAVAATGPAPTPPPPPRAGSPPRPWMRHMAPEHMRFFGLPRFPHASFVVQAQLRDGAWVSIAHRLPDEAYAWPTKLLLALGVLLISVVALSLIAVRGVTRPLAVLGNAAEELGRDIQRPPLDESGPLEVRRAAQAFNTMQSRLARFLRDRAQLLAAVSHDLKTPITRLRLRAELIEDPQQQAKFLRDLDEMEGMTRATLEFLRHANTREAVQPVDVQALVETLQADAEALGQEVQIQGTAGSPYPARALALQRCLANLLDNAHKYGRRATVTVDDNAERLRICVADEGPGIPEAELEQVFEPFYRLERSRSRETGGAGLGLSIARDVARAHGGDLVLRNRPNGGLEAVLTLPR
jgi:signal transduction histidine kinase